MSLSDHALPAPAATDAAMRGENFPVAGWFIEKRLRPAVRAFYAFARTADDIADDPALSTERKLALLDDMEAAAPAPEARDLLMAFRMDARNEAIARPQDLDRYCQYSAAPVGRFLLSLHGEARGQEQSDALCAALQILNHVQDVTADWQNLQRSYVPKVWSNLPGRTALDRMLAHAAYHLENAKSLPGLLTNRGLAAQSAAILTLARRLLVRLLRDDPRERRIKLGPIDWLAAASAGLRHWMLRG